MTNGRSLSRKHLRSVAWIGMGVFIGVLVFAVQQPAHALPEYATRTGQTCATCHVNPAGGGPRTLRGLLWVAQGKPDQVPPLPGSEEEPDTARLDGRALFEKFACLGCHGPSGEGGVGPALNQAELPGDEVAQVIRNGKGAMTSYKPDVMSDAELDALVKYVQALGRDEIQAGPVLEKRPLLPAQLACGARPPAPSLQSACGGN